MCHAGFPLHQRVGYPRLKMIGHAQTTGNLVRENGRRALGLGAMHFAHPYRDAVTHAARRGLKPPVGPIGCMERVMEPRLCVETNEIGADELAVLHADARVVNEIGYTARRVDLIIGTAWGARFCLDDLDAIP